MQTCERCDGPVVAQEAERREHIAGTEFVGTLRAWSCAACRKARFDDAEYHRFDLAIAARLAVAGAQSGEAFAHMRHALGLRAVDLGELLGAAPETISRWETGRIQPERRALALLGALVADEVRGCGKTEERLRALGAPTKLPETCSLGLFARARAA